MPHTSLRFAFVFYLRIIRANSSDALARRGPRTRASELSPSLLFAPSAPRPAPSRRSDAAASVCKLEVHIGTDSSRKGLFHVIAKASRGDSAESLVPCADVDVPPESGNDAAAWAGATMTEGPVVMCVA